MVRIIAGQVLTGSLLNEPMRLDRHEVRKVARYYPSVDAMIQPIQVWDDSLPYGGP